MPELVAHDGGRAVRTRVGHSFIKAVMAEEGAVFGGEHSAHFYFRDFWNADTGMLAAMHVLAALGEQDGPLSELGREYEPYVSSGEINSEIEDKAGAVERVRADFRGRGRRRWTTWTAAPSPPRTAATGSTCAPPTPSRSCA